MRQLKTEAYIALGLFVFALQFALAYQQPSLGLWSPFPFSVLRSIEMPILLCVAGAVSAFSAKSLVERKLFYSVIAASLAEIAIIKAMVWLGQPLLMLAIFSLNAFMTIQFLRYGLLVSAMNLPKLSDRNFQMPKEPATALGMILRFGMVATSIILVGHFFIVPTVSIKVCTIITAALLAPAVAVSIYQQIRLRRALAREKGFVK